MLSNAAKPSSDYQMKATIINAVRTDLDTILDPYLIFFILGGDGTFYPLWVILDVQYLRVPFFFLFVLT
jgi:hypothetical protein